jgi:hypothetical protein
MITTSTRPARLEPVRRTVRAIGKCYRCKRPIAEDVTTFRQFSARNRCDVVFFETLLRPRAQIAAYAACPCGTEVYLEPVRGNVTGHKCDPRCTGARGVDCECECGGANHGREHLLGS